MPATIAPAATPRNTASGCSSTALPISSGWSRLPSICCTATTMASMIRAYTQFCRTSTSRAAIAPETTAPTSGMKENRKTSSQIGTA